MVCGGYDSPCVGIVSAALVLKMRCMGLSAHKPLDEKMYFMLFLCVGEKNA